MTEPAGRLSAHGVDAPGGAASTGPSPGFDRSVSEAAGRIEAIIDAAERVASEIRGEARAEAERYREEAERKTDRLAMKRIGLISELTESLTERAEQVQRQSDELVRALEDAMRAVAAIVGDSRLGARAEEVPEHAPEDVPLTGAGKAARPPIDAAPPPAVTLRAARMAVTGSDREEIGAALADEFGILDPVPLLDRILGPASR